MIASNNTNLLYPNPKKCAKCNKKFYIGSKIKKENICLSKYYNTIEKTTILLILNNKFNSDVGRIIYMNMIKSSISRFNHIECVNKNNKNLEWLITGVKNMSVY